MTPPTTPPSEHEPPHARSTSRAWSWALSILAVPVLYILSVPPLWNHYALKFKMVPRWLELFVKPWTWLQETPLEPLMSAYAAWSYEQTLKSILPPPPPAKTVELTE